MDNLWGRLHPEVLNASHEIAKVGKFDDAIFAAFRVVEAEIQTQIGSAGVGQSLLDEAFDGPTPKIDISSDIRDRKSIKQLFVGAFGGIRNDRGHKKAPLTPCETETECLLYLQFATLLLTLLDKDRNTFPEIIGTRIHGTPEIPQVELKGRNFGTNIFVLANGEEIRLIRSELEVVEAILPPKFSGSIQVVSGKKESNTVFCDANTNAVHSDNSYRVIGADIPLYSDELGTTIIPNIVGVILVSNEGGKEFIRIMPTYPGRYAVDDYLSHGPFEQSGIGPAWYRPMGENRIEKAWDGALINVPNILGRSTGFTTGGLSVNPDHVRTQLGERRPLRAVAWESDGPSGKHIDVSEHAVWSVVDPTIAYVRNTVVIPKKLGETEVECRYNGFLARSTISIETIPTGQRSVFFKGLNHLQKICFDQHANLFISNQSPSVYKIGKDGSFSTVLRLSVPDTCVYAISCVAVDRQDRLYVNDLTRNACHRFDWDGTKFCNGVQLAAGVSGCKQSIAINKQGQVYIAVMGPTPHSGAVVRVDVDGSEHVFPTRDTAIYLALDSHDNLYIPNAKNRSIDVFNADGRMIQEFVHNEDDNVSDITVSPDGKIYCPLFRSGKIRVIRMSDGPSVREYLPGTFGTPGGIALDAAGRVYIADFVGGKIDIVY